MLGEVRFEDDIAGLKLSDVLENSSEKNFRTLKFILLLYIFRLMIQFNRFVLLQN